MVTLALCYVQPIQPSPAVLLSRGYTTEWEQALPSVKEPLKVKSAEWVDTVLVCCLLLPRGCDPSPLISCVWHQIPPLERLP